MEANNSSESERLRVLVSGGGTGGHIFPALSIANEVKRRMPEAESYPHLSPYLYCAANPILNIDPSGMDYHVIAYNDYVEIAADYYCYPEDFSAAQNAIEIISEQHFIYQIKHDDSIINLPIVFNLTPIIIDRDKGETFNEAINNSNGKGNVFQVTNVGMSDNQNGKTVNGNYIQIMESRIDSDTGAHEIGHTLGVIHSSGNNLMSEGSSQRTNTKFYRHSVEDIIKYPIKGKVNREKGIPSGKGLFFNNSIYDIPTLQKGKVKDVK